MIRRLLRKAAGRALRRERATQAPNPAPATVLPEEPEAPEPDIEIEEEALAQWMTDGQPLVLLDIREPHELQHGVAEGALIIRMNDIPQSLDSLPPLDTRIVVYCAAGGRSFGVTHWLRENGWNDTWSLTTGYHGYLRVSDRVAAGDIPAPLAKLATVSDIQAAVGPTGRPRLVNHWATWCDGCIEELPLLVKLHQAFGEDVDFIGLSWDAFQGDAAHSNHLNEVNKVNRTHGVIWPSLVITDPPEALFEALSMDVQTVPQIWLLDAQGQPVHKSAEVLDDQGYQALADEIRTMLD